MMYYLCKGLNESLAVPIKKKKSLAICEKVNRELFRKLELFFDYSSVTQSHVNEACLVWKLVLKVEFFFFLND